MNDGFKKKIIEVNTAAFSLVELSVVVVIIGILIAAVFVGNGLLTQAKLKSILSESTDYMNAVDLFESKYGGLPGDTVQAFNLWGTSCAASASLCNGNGNGHILYSNGTTQVESFRAWQHLSLAGMVKGSYTGVATTTGQADLNINVPQSNYSSGGWGFDFLGTYAAPNTQGQFLEIGGFLAGSPARASILKPSDTYNLDNKVDDGYPLNGMVWGYGTPGSSGCYRGTTISATYNTTISSALCGLRFTFRKY